MLKTKKPRRSVYQAVMTFDDDQHLDYDEAIYGITTPVNIIQTNFHDSIQHANINQRQPPSQHNTRIPPDVWSQLYQDDGLTWMKLSNETKATILGLKPPPDSMNTRKSMLHNISAFDFLNNIDTSYPNDVTR